MKKIILFDMDGTLINSSRDITISINYVRNTLYSLDPLNEQFVIDAINAHERNLATLFYETHVYEVDAKDLFEAHYWDQCICNVHPYDGIAEILENFKELGFFMSVATNAPSIFAKRMLEHLGIAQFFGSIIGADNVKFPKPHPEMLQILLEHHDYDEQHDCAWMVGDNSKDMQAAKDAKIGSIFATWGFSSNGEGDMVISSPAQLYEIIQKG
jgi:phosphoglycolate phosphatase